MSTPTTGATMPKINVYLPDDLADAVKEAGVPVSAVCQRALEQAVRRVTAIRQTALTDLAVDDLTARLPHFTPRAVAAVRLGIERAAAQQATEVGTGHLLGGVLAEGTNLALKVLRAMEIDPGNAGRLLDAPSPEAPEGTAEAAPPQFSQTAANALELAVTEATSLGHNYIGCEHLLLGLVAEPDGTGGQILRSLGAEPRPTRRAVTAALAGYVHLQSQVAAPAAATTPDAVATAVRQELQPLIQRLERLEQQAGLTGD
jgi:ATP-dependent Clp protease ATP-binding subunit ClpC